MDDLRSCYHSVMRLVPNDPTSDIPIIWYWAKPGAPRFTAPHAFGSSNWDKSRDEGPFSIGEQPEQRGRWSNGATHPSYAAECQVGTDLEFLYGLDRQTFDARANKVPPPCCGDFSELFRAAGGLHIAGTAYPRQYIPCAATAGGQGAYNRYYFRIPYLTNLIFGPDRPRTVWTLENMGSRSGNWCEWRSVPIVGPPYGSEWVLSYIPVDDSGYWVLGTFATGYRTPFPTNWTGATPLTLSLDFDISGYDGYPPTVTIYPIYPPYGISMTGGLRIGGAAIFALRGGFGMTGGLRIGGAAIISRIEATSPLVYDAPGTYTVTPPYGVSSIHIVVDGAGGGGGAGGDGTGGGGGGGGGRAVYDASLPTGGALSVTVGSAGLGGSQPGNGSPDGTGGGDSSFYDGVSITVTGQGGIGGRADGGGGGGGTGTGGMGESGDGGTNPDGGNGGDSYAGAAGGTGSAGAGADGASGSYPGAGGQGGGAETSPGSGAGLGGNGASGKVTISWV